jgi:Toprim domain
VESVRPALTYLTEVRGIRSWDCERLRAHPEYPLDCEIAPALVAPVNCHLTGGHVVGVWRVRLTDDGQKVQRSGVGASKGNASRLFWADGPDLLIAEGVEDALAAAELHGMPAWAALSAGNMGELVLAARFRRVLILADRDENQAGLRGAWALAHRLRAEGRTAEVCWPKGHKDPNDVLLAWRAAS